MTVRVGGEVGWVGRGSRWTDRNNGIQVFHKGRTEGCLLNICYDPATVLAPLIT